MGKKLLLVVLAVLGGWLAYRRLQGDKAEESLWAEATDTVPPAGGVR